MIKSIEEGRKEDGNRSIADKIKKRLHDLEKTVENNQGRWAWELLQNAKDSIADYPNRKIKVKIELDKSQVVFRHNGIHFTEKDIRGLINQISSKETEEGEETKRTGRFGTGFLTTHLLSKVITISGVVKTTDEQLYRFEFPLDREGGSTRELVPKIETAWEGFHKSATLLNNYNVDNYNTSFTYNLTTDKQHEIAKIGIEEFIKLIPYVLTFIQKIEKVEIINSVENQTTEFSIVGKKDENIFTIQKKSNGETSHIELLNFTNQKVTIAAEVEENPNGYIFKTHSDIPKLFCDFPLIGTENFHFPVVINSFFFNPQMERDGIWLKGNDDAEVLENQKLIEGALELYTDLIEKVSTEKFFNLFNISDSRLPNTNEKYFDESWYVENIQKSLRNCIFNSTIIEIEKDDVTRKAPKDVWFPARSYSNDVQESLWQYTYDLFPESVSKKDHIQEWVKIFWSEWQKLDYDGLAKDIEDLTSIEKLGESLDKDENDTFIWYNEVAKFILNKENNVILFENRAITPNKEGIFCVKSDLYIDKIKDNELVEVLQLLGENWNEILLNSKVSFGRYYPKEKKDIANEISSSLKNLSLNDENVIEAISRLSEWFESQNPKDSQELFGETYRKRAELFMNTIQDKESLYQVMRSNTDLSKLSAVAKALDENPDLMQNFNQAEQVSLLLEEYDVNSLDELKLVLENSSRDNYKPKLEITQEDLVSLGVTSMDELEEALKDKDLAALFSHTSKPNANMFLYAQSLITRSRKNIKKHLINHPEYDCTEVEELATTVLGGIKKNGVDVHIVIRPSDNGQVIVYYSSEKDTLDYANAELWIDNGKEPPKHLTLGHILKTTGINKIPV
ncbi:hypothetical protein ATO12_12620 [Aquimarina atlantica]|uniref:Histidine kinase/HSP90-like ATPase domain-containing protein n=1 Tax=Aquimarina atlantica TaxID=1317122 RepID=A0A023BY91_9FLAO|nr:hypothetical protein [Aquimarina atlantica]EZH74603.1 hypothetical protein ATO12_12620 [Aquimarina atlantica]